MAKRKSTNKKSRKSKWWIVPVILVALAILIYTLYTVERIRHSKFVRYPGFKIDLPDNYQIHGIDVSKYQDFIDWQSVKAMEVNDVKIGFAFIKATEGVANVDVQFRRNWRKAESAGMIKGAYHFFLASKSGKAQARNFISTVNLQPGDLPPVIDIEQLYGATPEKMRREVKEWLDVVEDHYKVKPIIYTYVHFYSHFLSTGQFDDYPLWIAHYLEKNKPRIDRPWLFWQHNETGRVNGITSRVDFNVFNGDSADFYDLLIKP
jgi:lysozyme